MLLALKLRNSVQYSCTTEAYSAYFYGPTPIPNDMHSLCRTSRTLIVTLKLFTTVSNTNKVV